LARSNIEVGVSKGYDVSKQLEMKKNKVVDEWPKCLAEEMLPLNL